MRRLVVIVAVALLTGCLSHHTGPMPDEPSDATYTSVADVRMRYLDTGGEGSPVVMLHGFASSLDTWTAVIPALAPGHRVIALDLKGFGWTDRPEGDYDPDTQARLVFELLDQLDVDATGVVAHSWGSSVALAMAHQQPERVERIALYDAWVYEEQLPVFFHWSRVSGLGEVLFALFYKERPVDKLEQAFYDPSIVPQSLVDEVEEALQRPGTSAAALEAVRGQNYAEIEDRYPQVTQPVLLLWGREDAVTTLHYGERLQKELPNAELVVYPQCGHFPMIEAYWASTRELVDFLAPLNAAPEPKVLESEKTDEPGDVRAKAVEQNVLESQETAPVEKVEP